MLSQRKSTKSIPTQTENKTYKLWWYIHQDLTLTVDLAVEQPIFIVKVCVFDHRQVMFSLSSPGMGTDLKEKLWNIGDLGAWPPPPNCRKFPPQQMIYAIWGYPEVTFYVENKLFRPHRNQLEAPYWWPAEKQQLQTTAHLTPMRTPLSSHLNESYNQSGSPQAVSQLNILLHQFQTQAKTVISQ